MTAFENEPLIPPDTPPAAPAGPTVAELARTGVRGTDVDEAGERSSREVHRAHVGLREQRVVVDGLRQTPHVAQRERGESEA